MPGIVQMNSQHHATRANSGDGGTKWASISRIGDSASLSSKRLRGSCTHRRL